MIKIYQKHPDDCLRAAICSLLELRTEEVLSFKDYEKVDKPIQWIYDNLGYTMIVTTVPDDWWVFDNKEVYHIRSMNVEGSEHSHAVVCKNGEIVHDPSPQPVTYTTYNHDYFFHKV